MLFYKIARDLTCNFFNILFHKYLFNIISMEKNII